MSTSTFQQWLDLCLDKAASTTDETPPDGVASRLRKEARLHFESLSQPPTLAAGTSTPATPRAKSISTIQQDISNASSATPNGALALLVSTLGPAVTSKSIDARGRGLYCLLGALEGCTSLTQGVRQAVGQFLVGLCRPDSRDGETGEEDGDQTMEYVDATNLTPEQVTQQLQEMQQRQRKSADGSNGKSGAFAADDLRDAAVTALSALIGSKLEIFPTQQSQSPSPAAQPLSPLNEALGVVQESMELRIELSMLGVRYRCQADKSDPTNDDSGMWGGAGAGYETGETDGNIADGLSQLPRAKRSICFNLLEGALDGLEKDESKRNKLRSQLSSSADDDANGASPTSLLKSMAAFASLASSCMHGETDPRCLLQLLRLLNKAQRVMIPLFDSNSTGEGLDGSDRTDIDAPKVKFPSVDMFDAVAPYYPVHFTPPKNDPHGITCAMLQEALMAVLCEGGVIYTSQPGHNQQSPDGEEEEAMIILAARMFLERLEPPKSSEYDPPSNGSESDVEDKLEAVRDLSSLLLPPLSSSTNGATGGTSGSERQSSLNATRLPPSVLSELSSAMARVHEEAVSSDTKSLASAVRKFASSLAHVLEHATATEKKDGNGANAAALWEAFVVDIVRHLSPILGSAPQGLHGRASTAYLASLAAEGGIMTLNKVLEGCYPRFLGVLSLLDSAVKSETGANGKSSQQKTRDEEKMAAAMRGVAALVSSCRVALQQQERENKGVQVYPHPLSPYISVTIQKVTFVLNEPLGDDEIGSLCMAAVGALESVLTAADLSGLEEEEVASLDKTFTLMSTTLFDRTGSQCKNIDEWKTACARVLGAVIALGMCQNESTASSDRMNAMAAALLPDILASSTSTDPSSSKIYGVRYDWMILSRACANGTTSVSERIVSEVLSRIIASLQSGRMDPKASARALAYLVRHGGPKVGVAFHSLSSPPGPSDLIQVLCEPPMQLSAENSMDITDVREKMATGQVGVGLSMLQLPESRAKDEEEASATVVRAYSTLPFLIPLYQCPSSAASCGSLVQFVDQVLPPLSKWDGVKLCVAFPLLAAVLENNKAWRADDTATRETLRSTIPFLAQYACSSDHDAPSRSAAASCLSSILLHSHSDEGFDGAKAISKIVQDVVHPAVAAAVTGLAKELGDSSTPRASASQAKTSTDSLMSTCQDAMGFLCLLGSISACKGGSLSQTADEIASFLMELACTGCAQFPFTDTTIQLVAPNEQGKKHPITDPASHAFAIPASAFGSMLSVQNGGPFWRQRMTHKTLPVLLKALKVQAKSQDPPALGVLAVVCHMLCCLPASILGKSNVQQILPTLVAGLVYFAKNFDALAQCETISPKPMEILSIVLAALIKTLTVSPKDVTKFVGIIIPSLLLLCSSTEASEAYIPKQLLVFQCLETVATHPHARNAVMREKDHVVTVLSATVDHPSSIVRNAVVQVRNVWYTLT